MSNSIVTISFFRYGTSATKWWAFRQMGLAPAQLQKVKGLRFSKMLGSGGGNGFSIWPNFGAYGLLGVWDDEEAARDFFENSLTFASFRQQSSAWWTAFMRAAQAHGRWDGQTPFPVNEPFDEGRLVAVITRATIFPGQLLRFWRFVPSVSRSMGGREGLIFSLGIGELPIIQQATFSLWKNSQYMKQYAYQSPQHQEVIRRTRQLGWYKEELFARFHPYFSEGNWEGGGTPLDGYL